MAKGLLSAAVAQRLTTAEGELAQLRAAEAPREVVKFERSLPRVADGFRDMLTDLPKALQRDTARARAGLQQFLGGQIALK